MSEIKPVSIKTVDERLNGIDFSGNKVEVSTEEFVALNDEVAELRAALEALQEKLDRMNGLYHTEVSKHQLDYNALQADNGLLKIALDGKVDLLKSCEIALEKAHAETAAQAKRINALEDQLSSFPIPTAVAMQKIGKLRSEGFKEYAATVLNKENQYCIVGDYGDVRWLSKNGE